MPNSFEKYLLVNCVFFLLRNILSIHYSLYRLAEFQSLFFYSSLSLVEIKMLPRVFLANTAILYILGLISSQPAVISGKFWNNIHF